jgi:hypothetical protein
MHLYRYELRQGDVVASTARFARPQPLDIGDRVEIGRAVLPIP